MNTNHRKGKSISERRTLPTTRGIVRPETGHTAVIVRPKNGHATDIQTTRERKSTAPKRAGRVNQRMINRMQELKQQGVTLEEIARQVGCSERTVRRHTEGVTPQLIHATDQPVLDLLDWCVRSVMSASRRGLFNAKELNQIVVHARKVVARLDPYTVEHLEGNAVARKAFLYDDVLRPVLRDIGTQRQVAQIVNELGPGAEFYDRDVDSQDEHS
jgi:AraC-like DNA-binding protein